jgi:hypothetical protein
MSKQIISRSFFKRVRGASLFILTAAIVITVFAVSTSAWLGSTIKAEPPVSPAKAAPAAMPQSNSARERIEAEIITIRPTGFEPTEITRPKGRFLLLVENHSGLGEVDLLLDRENGDRVREARVQRKPEWREVANLSPGRYLLKESNHPDWVCQITITDQ